jgi:predicted TIM-barrel fold metal-dependent hydrolase
MVIPASSQSPAIDARQTLDINHVSNVTTLSHPATKPTLIVDSHVHALPPSVMAAYRTKLSEPQLANEEGPPYLWASSAFEQLDEQVLALDASGIRTALITFSNNAPAAMHATAVKHHLRGPEMVRMVNDYMITGAKESNGRLVPTAWIEPRFGHQALEEMERVIRHLDVHAISMLTAYRGPGEPLRFLDHPMFLPVLEYAAALKIPVYVHTSGRFHIADIGEPVLAEPATTLLKGSLSTLLESALCLLRLIVNGVFDRLPDLHMVFGQLGGIFPFVLGHFDLIYESVIAAAEESETPDKKEASAIFRRLRDYVGQVYVDTHSMDQAAILCALEALGTERVLYGSDFPVTPARLGRQVALETIQSLPVNEDVKAAILGHNALSLLRINQLEGVAQ